jgi:quercetin dioxygenase-like cupin family protein
VNPSVAKIGISSPGRPREAVAVHTTTPKGVAAAFRRRSDHSRAFPPLAARIYEVVEGVLEVTVDGVTQIIRPGLVGIVPSNALYSVKALTDGRATSVDYPLRPEFN